MTYLMLLLLRPCSKWRGQKKIKSTSFHQCHYGYGLGHYGYGLGGYYGGYYGKKVEDSDFVDGTKMNTL